MAVFLGLIALAAVMRPPEALAEVAGATLNVFAAASLTDAFTEIARGVEREHPGLKVRLNFAGSNQLALQIEQGAPADVFASADERWMDHARERGAIEGDPRSFALNGLVAIIPRRNPGRIAGLADLARPGVKLVLAAEAVPAGRYGREVLRHFSRARGFPEDFAHRALSNLVSEEDNVRAVVTKVQLGEADAGLCYRSDIVGVAGRDVRVLQIPDSLNALATYPIAVLKSARAVAQAQAFVEHVLAPEGQRILERHGFRPVARP